MQYVEPYGLVPSGVYHIDEIKDSVNFYKVQVGIHGGADKDYREQLENGFKLDDEHYLRVFPVWFSFKGNAAVHLATGKAAALCGKFLKDKELMNIAEQQLFWIVGKNPFGQSLIWGREVIIRNYILHCRGKLWVAFLWACSRSLMRIRRIGRSLIQLHIKRYGVHLLLDGFL